MARMPSRAVAFWPAMFGGLTLLAGGCQALQHSEKGAVLGGLLGAGTGAVVGNALGNAGAGAAIGAGAGALGGAAIGNALDETEARNRAAIAEQLGRQVPAGNVTPSDVIAMTRAGVDEELIINHIRANRMVAPLQANDLIGLQQQGISTRVIGAMQESPPLPKQPAIVAQPAPTPVIVEEYYYHPYWGPCYRPYYRPPPGVHWGIAFGR
jgi:hypothetical protein